MTRVFQGQHDNSFPRWAWDHGITVLDSSATLGSELGLTGGDHSDLPLDFSDSLLVWGTSPTWQNGQQEEIRGSSCGQDFISTGVGLYLQESTPEVHEID